MATDESVVFVVDDDRAVREALQDLLRSAGWSVEVFGSAQEFLDRRANTEHPCCLVLDVDLPGLSGLDLLAQLGEKQSGVPIVFITGHGDIPMTVQAMRAGAVEFLTKPFVDSVLVDAVGRALERAKATRQSEREEESLRDRFASLTEREREVMTLVVTGLLNKQVAGRLGKSEITVKIHRRQVMQKMGAASLADLVRMAQRLGLELPPI